MACSPGVWGRARTAPFRLDHARPRSADQLPSFGAVMLHIYHPDQDRCLISEPIFGKGMRRSTFQWKKGFSAKRGEAIQWIRGLVRISTGKAIQCRGSGHSLNRRTLKTEKLLSSSPSRKSALIISAGGEKVCTKGVFSSENSSASTGRKKFGVYQKACFQGKKKENTYTPKRLQGVCGGPLHGVLVYVDNGLLHKNEQSARRRGSRPDILVDIRSKASGRPSTSWKNKYFAADIPRRRPWQKGSPLRDVNEGREILSKIL